MLWLAVFLPGFALDCCQRGNPAPDTPAGVCEGGVLVAVSTPAAAAGIRVGLTPATALALLPSIRLIERCAVRESDALHGLAAWALQFTATVSLQAPATPSDPAGLLLEVAGSLKLFGGLARLAARVQTGLRENGFAAQTGSAATPTGAWLLASHGDGLHADTAVRLQTLLARLPVRRLESARPREAALHAVGVHTVGELIQLPRAGLARRFGPDLLDELDRATGQRPDPRPVFEAPACFDSRLELPAPVEDAERLLFAARRLLLQLCGWLASRQGGARRITLRAEHERCPATLIRFGSDRPSRDPAQLGLLLTEALRRTRLAAACGCLRLQCEDVHDYAPPGKELFPGAVTAHEQIDRLVERLKARLGPGQVSQLHQVAEHRPEYAWRFEPARPPSQQPAQPSRSRARLHDAAARRAWDAAQPNPATLPAPLRPLWLIEPPIALSERNNRPFRDSPLSLLAGPDRIESGWWDDRLVLRDYFIAEDTEHRLLWIFRERFSRSGTAWYLHGRFG